MSRSLLLIDLEKRADEKLQRWVRDVFDLFDMAGLSQREAAAAIMAVLITQLGDVAAGSTAPDLEIAAMIIAARRRKETQLQKDPKYRKWRKKHGVT